MAMPDVVLALVVPVVLVLALLSILPVLPDVPAMLPEVPEVPEVPEAPVLLVLPALSLLQGLLLSDAQPASASSAQANIVLVIFMMISVMRALARICWSHHYSSRFI